MRRNRPVEPEPVQLNPDTYELSEGFMPSPATYHLLLPNRLRMTRLAWSAGRAVRRHGPREFTIQLQRPLNEEDCYASVTIMGTMDNELVSSQGRIVDLHIE